LKVIQITSVDTMMHNMLGALNKECIQQNIEVVAICEVNNHGQVIENTGVRLINKKIGRNIGLSNIISIFEIMKILKKEKPDIVHTHAPVASVITRIACKLVGIENVIYTAHGFYFHDEMSKLKYNFFFSIEKIMAKFFTKHLFVQSKEDTELAILKNFLPKQKIDYIGNGIDLGKKFNIQNYSEEKIKSIKYQFQISENEIVISFIGRLVEEKGIIDLLEAFEMINNIKIKLLIIGDLAPGERDLETVKKIEKYKKNNNIIFTGRREDINDLLIISDIYCLPSYREGMPRSIIEAMAMGNAIIATDIRGCREQVINNSNGYIVPLKSPSEIAKKIIYLAENVKVLQKFQENSIILAAEKYNEEKIVDFQINRFKELMGEKI